MKKNNETTPPWDIINDRFSITDLIHFENNRAECHLGNTNTWSIEYYPSIDRAYCHKCRKIYDYIEWFAQENNYSRSEAIKEICKRENIPFGVKDDNYIENIKKIGDVFEKLVKFSHERLKETEFYEILKKERGFTDETIKMFKIGLYDNLVRNKLEKIPQEDLILAGVMGIDKKTGAAYWNYTNKLSDKRFIFPYLDQNNFPLYFIYRWIGDIPQGKYKKFYAKYKKHKTTEYIHEIPFGLNSIQMNNNDLIITEGITDAISVIQANYPCLSPVTVRIKKKEIEQMVKYAKRFNRVIVINDNEENKEGLAGAITTLKVMLKNEIPIYIGEIPNPKNLEKIDLNDYLKEFTLKPILKTIKEGFSFLIHSININNIEEIEEIFELLPENNEIKKDDLLGVLSDKIGKSKTIIKKQFDIWRKQKKKVKKEPKEQAGKIEENPKEVPICSLIYDKKNNSTIYAELRTNGIYSYTEKTTKEGDVYMTEEVPLWIWEKFKINMVLSDEKSDETIKKYNFIFNDQEYKEKSFIQMKKEIELVSCIKAGYKQLFGPLINSYLQQNNTPEKTLKRVCGFTEEGWILPPEDYITFNLGIQEKFKGKMIKLMEKTVKEEQIKTFKKLYNIIKADHKDIIFAFGIIAPYMFALKKYTDLSFFLALSSPIHETGKSAMMKLVCTKIWGTPTIVSDQLNTVSKARDYLSLSTLPLGIDESEKLKDYAQDMLKSMATTNVSAQFKKIDQNLGMDKALSSVIIYAMNTYPEIFNDTTYLSRGVILPLNTIMKGEDKKEYLELYNGLEPGAIGKHIIEKTRNFTVQDLLEKMKGCPDPKGELKGRQITIFKLLHLGAMLFEDIFKIKLNLTDLERIIGESGLYGSDDIFEIVKIQLDNPDQRWVMSTVKTITHYNEMGFFYDANNLQDLKNRLKINISGVPQLREILSKRWYISEYKTFNINGSRKMGIFIPQDKLEKTTLEEIEKEYGSSDKLR